MKTRLVIGQKIVAVKQGPFHASHGMTNAIDYIELENGIRLYPVTIESASSAEYGTDLVVNTQNKRTP